MVFSLAKLYWLFCWTTGPSRFWYKVLEAFSKEKEQSWVQVKQAHGIKFFNLVFAKIAIVIKEGLSSLIQCADSYMPLQQKIMQVSQYFFRQYLFLFSDQLFNKV